jgi:tRNA A-37 threonylcarbamoyl transferase component Bud32
MSSATDRLSTALADRYRIERHLGEGGMATVYLAEDLKHDRKVAVKVLRPELAAVLGAERFVQEIKTTAQLQHPHILPLFDSGEADSFLYYVMPYVEGETLRDKLNREAQLGIEEAVKITTEVADALDYAHRHNVIHRDIKPENILLHDGRPMVADFGIALAVSAAAGGRMTETGMSLGTPHYMSPEQATADKDLTNRSDIYSLGCVLYEMLTGDPPHTGSTAQQVIMKIVTEEAAPLAQLRKSVPPHVAAATAKAVERLPADRFDSASDFMQALATPSFRHGLEGAPGEATLDVGAPWWRRVAVAALSGFGVLVVVLLWFGFSGQGRGEAVRRQRVLLGSGVQHLPQTVTSRVALAPDGSGIVFGDTVGAGGGVEFTYWWKPADRADPVPLRNMDNAVAVVFSPDGKWVAYVKDGQLRKQPLLGGTTVLLADSVLSAGVQALAWLDDGTLLFENTGPVLERISEDGGATQTIATSAVIGYPIHLSGLPGGALLSSCTDGSCTRNRLFLVDLERDTIQPLIDNVLRAWHVLSDRVVYVDRRGGVFSARLNRETLRLDPPVPLFDGVATTDRTAEMEIGANGLLLYVRGQAVASRRSVVWVDREGRAEPVDAGWGADEFLTTALSPQGDRLAVSVNTAGVEQVWVKELPSGPLTRLTVGSNGATRPAWTPDGQRVAYVASDAVGRNHARILRSDGSSSAPDTLLVVDGDLWEILISDDEGRVLFRVGNAASNADLGYADVAVDTVRTLFLNSPFSEHAVTLSPDGRWVAYVSNRSGRNEIYVRPFPAVGTRRIQVSANGGTEALWAHSGRELFYRDGEGWMIAASVTAEPEFQVNGRERLFDARAFRSTVEYRGYDVALDDQHFIMLQEEGLGGNEVTDLILVENWFTELRGVLDER